MKLLPIFNPELNVTIKFRVMSSVEVDSFLARFGSASKEEFAKALLEQTIFNLNTEVATSLRKQPKDKGKDILDSLVNGCLMLNPTVDVDSWHKISTGLSLFDVIDNGAMDKKIPATRRKRSSTQPARRTAVSPRRITKAKYDGLKPFLKAAVIGQDAAIDEVNLILKRSLAGLHDEKRPLGVFLLAGFSGTGKTLFAKKIHEHLYGNENLVRIDCGEYQHKHENAKLTGSPAGYIGYEDGGILTNALIENPNTVVLFDEIEKAHPDIVHTLLSAFDEGVMTDAQGNKASFRNAIIILTTNLGSRELANGINGRALGFGEVDTNAELSRGRVVRVTTEAVKKRFPPEFLNRIDKVIVFNHLTKDDFAKISELEFDAIAAKAGKRGYFIAFDELAVEAMVRDGFNPVQGARGLAQLRRDRIENPLADLILSGRYPRGTTFKVTFDATDFRVKARRPAAPKRRPTKACSSNRIVSPGG